MYVWRNIEARSRNQYYRGRAINITYFECVSVALVIQHAKHMRRIILSSATCLAIPYFTTLSHKRHDFREKVIEHKIYVLIFSTTFVQNISHSKNNWERYYHKCTLVFVYCTLYSCEILMKADFFQQVFEKYANIKFNGILSSGSRVVPCGQTDMTKLIVAFRNFANAPKMAIRHCNWHCPSVETLCWAMSLYVWCDDPDTSTWKTMSPPQWDCNIIVLDTRFGLVHVTSEICRFKGPSIMNWN
jgi:hypothetical protein